MGNAGIRNLIFFSLHSSYSKHMKTLFFPLLFIVAISLRAEDGCIEVDSVSYLQDDVIMASMKAVVLEQEKNWSFITQEDAHKQMKEREGRKLDIKGPRPRRKSLSSESLYKKVSDATLVVGRLYTCGKCSNTHFSFANTASNVYFR